MANHDEPLTALNRLASDGTYDDIASYIYDQMKSSMLVTARGILGVPGDAEDVFQDFVFRRVPRVLRAWRRERRTSPFVAYLRRSFRNHCLLHLKRTARIRQLISLDFVQEILPAESVLPVDEIERTQFLAALRRAMSMALQELDEKYRQPMMLFLRDVPNVETARRLGRSEDLVNVHLTRARQKLRVAVPRLMMEVTTSQIVDWPTLCRILVSGDREAQPSPHGRVWQCLRESTRGALRKEAAATTSSGTRMASILSSLNDLLIQPDLFSRPHFERLIQSGRFHPQLRVLLWKERDIPELLLFVSFESCSIQRSRDSSKGAHGHLVSISDPEAGERGARRSDVPALPGTGPK